MEKNGDNLSKEHVFCVTKGTAGSGQSAPRAAGTAAAAVPGHCGQVAWSATPSARPLCTRKPGTRKGRLRGGQHRQHPHTHKRTDTHTLTPQGRRITRWPGHVFGPSGRVRVICPRQTEMQADRQTSGVVRAPEGAPQRGHHTYTQRGLKCNSCRKHHAAHTHTSETPRAHRANGRSRL